MAGGRESDRVPPLLGREDEDLPVEAGREEDVRSDDRLRSEPPSVERGAAGDELPLELTGRATRGAAGGDEGFGGDGGACGLDPDPAGTSTIPEQEGHRIFLPATLSGTFRVLLH